MENQDKVQDVLSNFVKTPSKDIPPTLEDYLRSVAKTGKTVFPWQQLKTLFVQKLEQVMEQFVKEDPCEHQLPFPNTKYEEMRCRIIDALQRFTGAPFTVQRICELVTQPKKHYTQCDKFLRGIEKNVMVVSTVDPSGRKIVSESRAMVNGLDLNGVDGQRDDFNDITDEQPFGSGPQVDWSGNNVATVWPVSLASENQSNSNNSNNSAADDCKADSLNGDEKTAEVVQETSESQIKKTTDSEPEESLVVTDCVVKDSIPKISNQSDSEPQSNENARKDSETSEQSPKVDSSTEKETESVTTSEQVSESIVSTSENETDSKSEVVTTDEVRESSGEKHVRDVTESSVDEPPEKKQKIESDGEDVKADTDEMKEPALVTQTDNTVEMKEPTRATLTDNTDEVKESAQVTQTDNTDAEVLPEAGRITSSETEQTCEQAEDKSSEEAQLENSEDKTDATEDDKHTTESSPDTESSDTPTQDQSDINKVSDTDTTTNITDIQSTTQSTDVDSVVDEQVKEQVSDNVTEDSITSEASNVVTDQDTGADNVSGAEAVVDSNSGTELMETDSVVKQDEEVTDVTDSAVQEEGVTDVTDAPVDESEPMEHD